MVRAWKGSLRRLSVAVLCGVVWCAGNAAHAEGFYQRGDADCSLTFTAADLVAVAHPPDPSVCDNSDCNRDGVINAADVDCGISCMFDTCLTPPNAPEVAAIELETGDVLAPYTTVHLRVDNIDDVDQLKRVTFAGIDAEVVDFVPPDDVVVVVPPIAPGLVEIVVYAGDLAGVRTAIDVAAQMPIGAPDSLDSTLDLLDTAAARFVLLPLEGHFGADAMLVGSALEDFRDELAQQREALANDPTFTPAARAELDTAFDSSGVADALRGILADIDAIIGVPGSAGEAEGEGGAQQTVAVGNVARNFKRTIKIARGVIAAGAAATSTSLSAPAAGIAILAGVAAGVLTLAGSAALPPIILGVNFTTADARPIGGPTPGGFAVVRGRRLIGTNLVLRVAGGAFVIPSQFDNDDSRQFRLPGDAVGFCGRASYYLERSFPLAGRSTAFPDGVIPVLESFIGPNPVVPGDELRMRVHGVSGCLGVAIFSGAGVENQAPLEVLNPTLGETRVPNREPGTYGVYLLVDGRRSETRPNLTLETGVRSVSVTCTPSSSNLRTDLVLRPGTPNAAMCSATTLPPEAIPPRNSYFSWRSSDPATAKIALSAQSDRVSVDAEKPGSAEISATLKVEQQSFASTNFTWGIRVTDQTAPTVALTSSSPASVSAGTPITVSVRATDNYALSRVTISAAGDPVVNGDQEQPCLLQERCSASFTINTSRTFDRNQITVMAEAFDSAGNMATSATLSFTVTDPLDETCPTVSLISPANGGSVNAGSSNVAMATATDDVGVKRFHYTATGEALVAAVAQDLTFPEALASANLNFNYAVKPASELSDIIDTDITISVQAFDVAGNTCDAKTAVVSVIGVLDQCEGSITTDNPSGYIDEAFTITVTIVGSVAQQITRVTSINPGGQFDLTPRGNGVYQVTLFYQGRGSFTLSFTAFDTEGNDRCTGSIGLEALGPSPG